jgi:hypothetical protein
MTGGAARRTEIAIRDPAVGWPPRLRQVADPSCGVVGDLPERFRCEHLRIRPCLLHRFGVIWPRRDASADRYDPVPDEMWEEATRRHDETRVAGW